MSGGSANELNISGDCKNYTDEDNVFVNNMEVEEYHDEDIDEEDDELEREMALETFETLKSDSKSLTLSVSDFLKWDDIKDIMSTSEDNQGVIDNDTMDLILQQCNIVKDKGMDFETFLEVVELVNQGEPSLALCSIMILTIYCLKSTLTLTLFFTLYPILVALTLESDADVDNWNPIAEQAAVDAAMKEQQSLHDMQTADFQALIQSLGLKKNPDAAS